MTVLFLALPFLACLILTAIHAYLGLHIVRRGVIFVDLALAQVAALGVTVALLFGYQPSDRAAYGLALAAACLGAAVLALTRQRRERVPQEAIIGIVYVVSAAASILVLDRAPGGAEHIRSLLVGNIVTVTPRDVGTIAALYAAVALFHWRWREPLLALSFAPERFGRRSIFIWDFLFYLSFAVVVTSSVRLAGVLPVFAYLVVPAVGSSLLTQRLAPRLVAGWIIGGCASAVGLWASYALDLPTGASIVCAFGLLLLALAAMSGLRRTHSDG